MVKPPRARHKRSFPRSRGRLTGPVKIAHTEPVLKNGSYYSLGNLHFFAPRPPFFPSKSDAHRAFGESHSLIINSALTSAITLTSRKCKMSMPESDVKSAWVRYVKDVIVCASGGNLGRARTKKDLGGMCICPAPLLDLYQIRANRVHPLCPKNKIHSTICRASQAPLLRDLRVDFLRDRSPLLSTSLMHSGTS